MATFADPRPPARPTASAAKPLARLRSLCLRLPEVTERPSHGEPAWFIRGKRTFLTFADHHHDSRVAFWCAAPDGAQAALIAAHPGMLFRPPYVGTRGWIGCYLDVADLDWDLIELLVLDAFRAQAPKTLLAELERADTAKRV